MYLANFVLQSDVVLGITMYIAATVFLFILSAEETSYYPRINPPTQFPKFSDRQALLFRNIHTFLTFI